MRTVAIAITAVKRIGSVNIGNVSGVDWNDNNRQVNLNENNADNQNDNARLRASAMVYVLYVDLSQPPSILPISSILFCSWKTTVSFTSLNSIYSRNFILRTSKEAVALIR